MTPGRISYYSNLDCLSLSDTLGQCRKKYTASASLHKVSILQFLTSLIAF